MRETDSKYDAHELHTPSECSGSTPTLTEKKIAATASDFSCFQASGSNVISAVEYLVK